MKWGRLALAAVICIASLAWVSRPARADIAPPQPPQGVSVEPGSETTNVRMVSETVTMTVASYSVYPSGLANVKAIFHMRNLGDTVEQMNVRFPMYATGRDPTSIRDQVPYEIHDPPLENSSVQVDYANVIVSYTQEKTIQYSNEDDQYHDISIPAWANFPVTFPPGKDVIISVEYI